MSEPDIGFVANLLGDPSRAAICLTLMDGRTVPASELARRAGISAQTTSNHLSKLIRGGIVAVEQRGRWRYYRLASEEVARAVEALAVLAPRRTRAHPEQDGQRELYAARTCYRHLAGKLGVALADGLLREGWIATRNDHFVVTPTGSQRFSALGIEIGDLRSSAEIVVRKCLDWSERRPHVAGPLGKALAELALTRDWVRRQRGTRAILVTPLGRAELRRLLGVDLSSIG